MKWMLVGVGIVIYCGIYELALAMSPRGQPWHYAVAVACFAYALIRGCYLLREAFSKR
jgi:hypothetical protein